MISNINNQQNQTVLSSLAFCLYFKAKALMAGNLEKSTRPQDIFYSKHAFLAESIYRV